MEPAWCGVAWHLSFLHLCDPFCAVGLELEKWCGKAGKIGLCGMRIYEKVRSFVFVFLSSLFSSSLFDLSLSDCFGPISMMKMTD